jgi:hypothetical protein
MNKILYIGAGHDTNIINIFPNSNNFILIDTLPRSSWDEFFFEEQFYRKNFIEEIKTEFKKIGFELINIIELNNRLSIKLPFVNSHLLEFKNCNKYVKYYISTNINNDMCPMLEKDLIESDTLYIQGYFPDIKLFEYFTKKKTFVGASNNIYNDPEPDCTNIITHMQNNNNSDDYFDSYYTNNILIQCNKQIFYL